MTSKDPHVLVLGGDSRLGKALRRDPTVPIGAIIRRTPASAHEYTTTDYASIPSGALDGIDVVINCVGTPKGSNQALWHVNAEIPLAAAQQAKAAGVRRFVQISSFSVYGGHEKIGRNTPVAPVSAYGRAKAHADRELAALAGPDFKVVSLRLPAIVDVAAQDKLNSLIRLWLRIRHFPIPHAPILRSMVGVDLAAAAVHRALDKEGILHAADPSPFEYGRAALAISGALGRRVDCLLAPKPMLRLLALTAPAIHDSLYRDSLLDPGDNLIATEQGYPTLYEIITTIARDSN